MGSINHSFWLTNFVNTPIYMDYVYFCNIAILAMIIKKSVFKFSAKRKRKLKRERRLCLTPPSRSWSRRHQRQQRRRKQWWKRRSLTSRLFLHRWPADGARLLEVERTQLRQGQRPRVCDSEEHSGMEWLRLRQRDELHLRVEETKLLRNVLVN